MTASTTLVKEIRSPRRRSKKKVEKMLGNIKKEEDKVVYIKSGVGVSYGDVVNRYQRSQGSGCG